MDKIIQLSQDITFSKREKEVLEHMLRGESVKNIRLELNLKSNTISTYKKKIFLKTGTKNIIELFQLVNKEK